MIKWSFHQEDMDILDVCEPNNRAVKYVKQKLAQLKGETDKPTFRAGDFNTPIFCSGQISQTEN